MNGLGPASSFPPAPGSISRVWAEEEIGSSSLGPWIRPSTTARRNDRVGSAGGILRRLAACPTAAHDRIDHTDDHQREHDVVDVLEALADFRPVAPDGVAGEREAHTQGTVPMQRETG